MRKKGGGGMGGNQWSDCRDKEYVHEALFEM